MLTAAAHKKLSRSIVLQEDEVTSCIFGEMQHLPTDVIWKIFKHLTKDAINDTGAIEALFCKLPDKVNFKFWPEWKTKKYGSVEPDLVVHFFKDDKPILNIIVEVKWNASLFPPCELIRQWSRREVNNNKAPWVHLYLVKDKAKGLTEVERSLLEGEELCKNKNCPLCVDKDKAHYMGPKFNTKQWRKYIGCIGWQNLIVAVTQIVQKNLLWNDGVSVFFEKQGIVPFTGFAFTWLNEEDIKNLLSADYIFFRSDP